MRRRFQLALLLLLAATMLRADDVVERIAATVNGHVVLSSEVESELAYECMMDASQCSGSPAARKQAIERLIDRQLVAQQMLQAHMAPVPSGEVQSKLEELKAQLLRSAGRTNETWAQMLERYRLSEAEVAARVRAELDELRFIDARFRPAVYVSPSSVERYYQKELVPKLPRNSPPPELRSVTPQIREVLTQQAIDQDFTAWLAALRQQSEIEVR